MKELFCDSQIWKGAFYELAIELSSRSDERLKIALSAIWKLPFFSWCQSDLYKETKEKDQGNFSNVNIKTYGHLRGIAILPDKQRIPCGTVSVREEEGIDWLDFYIPLGAIERTYKDVGGFFGTDHPKSRDWREPLENWLAEIGREVFSVVEFRLGLIGCEVSGVAYASELAISGVPKSRGIGNLWPTSEGIQYFPTNKW